MAVPTVYALLSMALVVSALLGPLARLAACAGNLERLAAEYRRTERRAKALENVLLRLSEMVCELPWLAELDINPLLVDENGARELPRDSKLALARKLVADIAYRIRAGV